MRSQNIKYNSFGKVGGGSCLLLLLLAFLAVNPMMGLSVFAEEGDTDGGDSVVHADEGGVSAQMDEGEPVALVDVLDSSVRFSFGEPVGTASMMPVGTAGASALYSVRATVDVTNSGGYTVYLGSNKSELTGKNSGTIINAVSSSTAYENMPNNSWGYSAKEGTVAGTTFSAMPAYVRGAIIGSNSASRIRSDSKTFTLSFAAHIGSDRPADTYESQVTMSVVTSPLVLTTLGDITDMQEMTSEICADSAVNDTKQLKDTRDGKYYWVSKLADGKCWMTQNLDLDLSTSTALTSATSDVSTNWTPGYATATTATSSTILADNTGQRSWSLGDYRITNPTASSDCGSGKNSAANCSSQFTAYTTPTSANGDANAHYILGNHYQWNAATAGTGGTITSGQATSSICPKGWRLPTSNTGGEFETLVTKLGGTSSTDNVTKSPFYGVRGGAVFQTTNLFNYAGGRGYYWSSTPVSNGTEAYRLTFSGTSGIDPSSPNNRQGGFSVRCVAR